MILCIKTKHFITIRLKNPMKTQLLYKYKCFFFVDIYSFFSFDINKKDNLWENTKY